VVALQPLPDRGNVPSANAGWCITATTTDDNNLFLTTLAYHLGFVVNAGGWNRPIVYVATMIDVPSNDESAVL
jgi:hypothetical protein